MKAGAKPAYQIYRGSDLGAPAFRVVSRCPPTPDDFLSYAEAGRSFRLQQWFRATGVSMFIEKRAAMKLARGGVMGTYVAEVDIDNDMVYFCLTNARTGHLDVWAAPRLLAGRVVNCDETAAREKGH